MHDTESITSKSPRQVAAVALEVGKQTLSDYRLSRKDFTLTQLFACLVLRKFFQTDYRGIVAILNDWPAPDLIQVQTATLQPCFFKSPRIRPRNVSQ